MYIAFMLSEKMYRYMVSEKHSEKQRNLWAGNYTGSFVVTSISLSGPFITNVKYWMRGIRVQEILSSDRRHFAKDKISVSTKGCCLTGHNNREACSFTWPETSHATQCLTSRHKRNIYLNKGGSELKGGWWSHCWWFRRYVLFNLYWFLMWARPRQKVCSFPFTQKHKSDIVALFPAITYLTVFSFLQRYEPRWSHPKGAIPEWHPATRCHTRPGAAGRAVPWGVQADPGAGDPDRPAAAHTPSPGGREEKDGQVGLFF